MAAVVARLAKAIVLGLTRRHRTMTESVIAAGMVAPDRICQKVSGNSRQQSQSEQRAD